MREASSLFSLSAARAMADSKRPDDRSQSDIRTACKNFRAQIPFEEQQLASQKIADKVISSDLFLRAIDIAVYIPMESEVDTWPIIKRAWQMKKRIFAPITRKTFTLSFRRLDNENELLTSKMGLREPINGQPIQPDALDLVLTPLVAFDAQKNRIGMGGGYYDRTFAFLKQKPDAVKPVLAGLAFEGQRVEKIPSNPWDIRLLHVFTESTEA